MAYLTLDCRDFNTVFARICGIKGPGERRMWGLGWKDLGVVCAGVALLALHFALTGAPSRLLSPWLICSILAGWIFGRVALHRIERPE